MDDAVDTGLASIVKVIDTGSDVPGIILEECSTGFRELFNSAGVVIAKGQGNYETLNETGRSVFFLFKVKCGVVAGHCGHAVGDIVLLSI